MWRSSSVLLFVIACATASAKNTSVAAVDMPAADPPTRIVGGTTTNIETYPFVVQVSYNNQAHCAGSLLTSRHVLSAAHCYLDRNGNVANPRFFNVRVSTTYLNKGGVVHGVARITAHEGYDAPRRDNDVAVLLLASSARVAGFAPVPRQGATVPDDAPVTYVGWGRTNASVPVGSDVLMEVVVRTVAQSICAQRYRQLQQIMGEPYPITDNMICAGILDVGGKDACQGDSGGPLLYQHVVVGVTSWGYGCAQPHFPGVSARVASYTNWIINVVNGSPAGASKRPALLAAVFVILQLLLLCNS